MIFSQWTMFLQIAMSIIAPVAAITGIYYGKMSRKENADSLKIGAFAEHRNMMQQQIDDAAKEKEKLVEQINILTKQIQGLQESIRMKDNEILQKEVNVLILEREQRELKDEMRDMNAQIDSFHKDKP